MKTQDSEEDDFIYSNETCFETKLKHKTNRYL